MAKKSIDDRIFLFIGDQAFTLKDLGPAADMRIDKAIQSILDQGLLGPELIGVPWYDVIKSSDLQLESQPSEEDILQYSLFKRYREELERCRNLNKLGTLTQADKDKMLQLRRDWESVTKLAKP
jgi:hypothetical protein